MHTAAKAIEAGGNSSMSRIGSSNSTRGLVTFPSWCCIIQGKTRQCWRCDLLHLNSRKYNTKALRKLDSELHFLMKDSSVCISSDSTDACFKLE